MKTMNQQYVILLKNGNHDIIIISLFAVVITTHLKIKIQTNNEKVKSIKIKS